MESIFKEKEESNKIKSVKHEMIKNDYFFRILFNHLETKKLLDIVKYNKNLKKKN